jgi:hypothetical protein
LLHFERQGWPHSPPPLQQLHTVVSMRTNALRYQGSLHKFVFSVFVPPSSPPIDPWRKINSEKDVTYARFVLDESSCVSAIVTSSFLFLKFFDLVSFFLNCRECSEELETTSWLISDGAKCTVFLWSKQNAETSELLST